VEKPLKKAAPSAKKEVAPQAQKEVAPPAKKEVVAPTKMNTRHPAKKEAPKKQPAPVKKVDAPKVVEKV
jgi:hypothetical protein